MTSGGPGLDQTEWSGLLKGAQGGKLKLLKVDAGALRKIVSACEAFAADIKGLIDFLLREDSFPKFSWVYDNKAAGAHSNAALAESRVTTLYSMKMLFDKFDDKRTVELVDILKNHQAIVTVMANTFGAAHKSFSKTDDDNASMFHPPAQGTNHWPEIAKFHATPSADWKSGPGLPTTAGSGVSFDSNAKGRIEGAIESGDSLSLLDFAAIAEMIERNGGNTFWMAGEWKALATVWRRSVQKFTDEVDYVFKNQYWEGAGADRAVAFLDKYLQSTDTLQRGMESMSNVIGNTANFNFFIKSHQPLYEHYKYIAGSVSSVQDFTDVNDVLTRARTFWDKGDASSAQKGYRGGITQLAGYIPTFTDPNKMLGASGDLPGSYNYKDPTGNNGGGSGGGKGGGGTGGGKDGGGNSGGGTGSGKSGGGTGGGGEGKGTGGGAGSAGSKPPGSGSKPPGSGGGTESSSRPPSSAKEMVPGGATGPVVGATGPLSALTKALQQLASGMMSGPSLPFASGPWDASGPTGASGPFGFDIKPAGVGGGSAGGSAAGAGKPANPLEDKLFPRAAAPGNSTEAVTARAGMAPSAAMPYGGYPMGGGMGGGAPGGQQQQQQQRKRAAYLDSTEHLEEAVGEDPLSVRPIIDR
ncbi:hypothetical protein [Nocardia suismassiliense]|uniref:hypothetical protein n=1 Tax=Nocardia suismassiliense TaxID=2077092 RepID=UPI00131F44E8|nr:hypothetical protein [Nocardia suismassiliense]